MMKRGSGVLLHITSLPSPYGIGDLGPEAYRFIDFLAETRQSYWQILPINPTSTVSGNSPYNSDSAFAGNPLLISPDLLQAEGLLSKSDMKNRHRFSEEKVNYDAVTSFKQRVLYLAYERCKASLEKDPEFARFSKESSDWLDEYAVFKALKNHFNTVPWNLWPKDIKDRDQNAILKFKRQLKDQILLEQFLQFIFFKQWLSLKHYSNNRKVQIIGDIPIYVQYDSVDVWTHPKIFKLDDERRPTVVAGVPPDYFSKTGQLWGNPVYNWEELKTKNYGWWIQRLAYSLKLFNRVRLDHFRGLVGYWEIPADQTTAINGRWMKAPADDFFNTLARQLPDLPVLAEDLGVITPDVREVMQRFGFPGMKVLMFAFGPDLPTHPYAPHNYTHHSAVYTGTHDTKTVKDWFMSETSPEDKKRLSTYIGHEVSAEEIHWDLIRLALMSVADTAIIPMQDLLGLGDDARMNRPAVAHGNWEWRLLPKQITRSLIANLSAMTEIYGRG
jgi:4-alpha-glucanotransferase